MRLANHYVPQTYLKRWTCDGESVWIYRVLVSHDAVPVWRKNSPRGLAYHKHLYTRVAATGESDEIERWLDAEFESPAEGVLQKIATNRRLTAEEWERLVRFAAAQDVRTPARLVEMLRRWELTLPALVESTLKESVAELELASKQGRKLTASRTLDQELLPIRVKTRLSTERDAASLGVEMVAGRGLWLFTMRHLLSKTIKALLGHKWTILRAPPNFTWITSDDPVIRLNFYGRGQYDFKGGWGSKGTKILFPVTPSHLLYTKIGERPPDWGSVVPHNEAMMLQRFFAEHAHRFIFACYQDPSVTMLRPRAVNREAFNDEKAQWARWHADQVEAERSLITDGEQV